jgi:hypothetical protein
MSQLFVAALLLAGTSVARTQEQSSEPVLRIGVHSQQQDGRFAGFAGDAGIESFQSYVWANESLCMLSASDNEPSTTPAVGWHFRGRVLKRTGDDFLVDIEWARLWDKYTRLAEAPKGSLQVTLRPNEPLTLDEITPRAAGCQVIGARLEAAILPQPRSRSVVGGGGRGAGGVGAAGAAAGGAGAGGFATASGGRAGGGTGPGAGGRGTTGAGGRGAGSAGASPAVTGDSARGISIYPSTLPYTPIPETYRQQFDAEVWLVHKLPSGNEEVQRLTLVFGRTATRFAFPPVEVVRDGEKGTVDVAGTLYIGSVRSQEKLVVHLDRTIKKRTTMVGGSFKPIDIPAGSEVLSFELPTNSSDSDLRSHFHGHEFSVRLRVTPK